MNPNNSTQELVAPSIYSPELGPTSVSHITELVRKWFGKREACAYGTVRCSRPIAVCCRPLQPKPLGSG